MRVMHRFSSAARVVPAIVGFGPREPALLNSGNSSITQNLRGP
jgi:hypothetical protein